MIKVIKLEENIFIKNITIYFPFYLLYKTFKFITAIFILKEHHLRFFFYILNNKVKKNSIYSINKINYKKSYKSKRNKEVK